MGIHPFQSQGGYAVGQGRPFLDAALHVAQRLHDECLQERTETGGRTALFHDRRLRADGPATGTPLEGYGGAARARPRFPADRGLAVRPDPSCLPNGRLRLGSNFRSRFACKWNSN